MVPEPKSNSENLTNQANVADEPVWDVSVLHRANEYGVRQLGFEFANDVILSLDSESVMLGVLRSPNVVFPFDDCSPAYSASACWIAPRRRLNLMSMSSFFASSMAKLARLAYSKRMEQVMVALVWVWKPQGVGEQQWMATFERQVWESDLERWALVFVLPLESFPTLLRIELGFALLPIVPHHKLAH